MENIHYRTSVWGASKSCRRRRLGNKPSIRSLCSPASIRTAAALSFASLLGCSQDLPDERLIIAPRVLSISTNVVFSPTSEPDAPGLPPKVQALPFDTVKISPLIVTPEGVVAQEDLAAAHDPIWIACELAPGSGLFGCISKAMPTALGDLPDCLVPSPLDLSDRGLPEFPTPCIIAREGAPEFVVPLTANMLIGGDFEITMIASSKGGTSTDACASPFLNDEHRLPDDCLYGVQRLSLGPREQLAALIEQFGGPSAGLDSGSQSDVPAPDRAMHIADFTVIRIDPEGEILGQPVFLERGDSIRVGLGETIRIDVSSPKDDLQSYFIPINNGEDFEERTETYDAAWYRTWGSMLSGSSNDPDSYNEWTLLPSGQDDQLIPDAPIHLYYVVRDGRQGVNEYWFSVEIEP